MATSYIGRPGSQKSSRSPGLRFGVGIRREDEQRVKQRSALIKRPDVLLEENLTKPEPERPPDGPWVPEDPEDREAYYTWTPTDQHNYSLRRQMEELKIPYSGIPSSVAGGVAAENALMEQRIANYQTVFTVPKGSQVLTGPPTRGAAWQTPMESKTLQEWKATQGSRPGIAFEVGMGLLLPHWALAEGALLSMGVPEPISILATSFGPSGLRKSVTRTAQIGATALGSARKGTLFRGLEPVVERAGSLSDWGASISGRTSGVVAETAGEVVARETGKGLRAVGKVASPVVTPVVEKVISPVLIRPVLNFNKKFRDYIHHTPEFEIRTRKLARDPILEEEYVKGANVDPIEPGEIVEVHLKDPDKLKRAVQSTIKAMRWLGAPARVLADLGSPVLLAERPDQYFNVVLHVGRAESQQKARLALLPIEELGTFDAIWRTASWEKGAVAEKVPREVLKIPSAIVGIPIPRRVAEKFREKVSRTGKAIGEHLPVDAEKVLPFEDVVIKAGNRKGQTVNTWTFRNDPGIPKILRGKHLNDVLEQPKKYADALTPLQNQWIRRMNWAQEAKTAMMKRNGVDVHELPIAEGGAFAGRIVLGKVDEAGELLETAILDPKLGSGIATINNNQHRVFATAQEGAEAGYIYLRPDQALGHNLESGFRVVSDNKAMKWLREESGMAFRETKVSQSRIDLVTESEGFVKGATALQKTLKRLLDPAFQGRGTAHWKTIQLIAKHHEGWAKRLNRILAVKTTSVQSALKKHRKALKAVGVDAEEVWGLLIRAQSKKATGDIPVEMKRLAFESAKKSGLKFLKGKRFSEKAFEDLPQRFKNRIDPGKMPKVAAALRQQATKLTQSRVGRTKEVATRGGGKAVRYFGPGATPGQFSDVLSAVGKQNAKAVKELERAFDIALQSEMKAKKEALKKFRKEVEGQLPELKSKRDAAKKTLQDYKKWQIRAWLGQKAVPPKYLNLDIEDPRLFFVEPEDYARIEKIVKDELLVTWPITNMLEAVNDFVRWHTLGGDMAVMGLQLQTLSIKNPKLYAKSATMMVRAMEAPEFAASFYGKPEVRKFLRDHPTFTLAKGGGTDVTRMLGPGGWLGGPSSKGGATNAKRVADGMWDIFRQTGKSTLEPSQRGFEFAIDYAAINFGMGLARPWHTARQRNEVARTVNQILGISDSRLLGTSKGTRQVERMLGSLAPRYARAIASLLFDFTRGGLRGDQARKSILSLWAGLNGVAVIQGVSRGETWEEIAEHINPDHPNFQTFELWGQKIGLAGKQRSFLRLLTKIALDPGGAANLRLGNLAENPLFRAYINQAPPVVGAAGDLFRGRSVIGEPIYGSGDVWTNVKGVGKAIAHRVMPIWAATAFLDEGSPLQRIARGAFEYLLGLRTRPMSAMEWYVNGLVRNKPQPEHYLEGNYDAVLGAWEAGSLKREDITGAHERYFRGKTPKGKALWEAATQEKEHLGREDALFVAYQKGIEKPLADLVTNAEAVKDGTASYTDFRKAYREYGSTIRTVWNTVIANPAHARTVAELDEIPTHELPEDALYRRYLEIVQDPALDHPIEGYDFDARDLALYGNGDDIIGFKNEIGEDGWRVVTERRETAVAHLPDIVTELLNDRETLRPYFEIASDVFNTPMLKSLYEEFKSLSSKHERNEFRDNNTDLANHLTILAKERRWMREDFPNIDRLLLKWYDDVYTPLTYKYSN